MEQTTKIFRGGLPTDPDVAAIRERYPDAMFSKGDFIAYEAIGEVIQALPGSTRFRTVTAAWRRAVERDAGLVIECDRVRGFVVATDSRKVALGAAKLRTAYRLGHRAHALAQGVDRAKLSPDERRQHDFLLQRSAAVMVSAQAARKAQLPAI